jgi:flagellin
MPLNIVSNGAASIANRALQQADREMTTSLRKLASGSRVETARDDAASMAIGSRLRAELSSLRTVSTNAQQGIAVFQIAEGGMARVYDILVRLKALASQAGSSQLSSTERGMLDTEYQAMVDEIDRLAANTTFNNNAIINANMSYSGQPTVGDTNSSTDMFRAGLSTMFNDFGFGGLATGNVNFSISGATDVGIYVSATQGTRTLSGVIGSNQIDSGGALISGTAVRLTSQTATGLNSGDNAYISLSFNKGADLIVGNTSILRGTLTLGQSSTTTFAFKVGTSGISANDEISLAVRGMNSKSLGITNSNITSVDRADAASAAVTEAINVLLNARSEVGAIQNRLESAQNNINTILENIEAARSAYLDLDIAAEMATFTSKQILVQAGVSMLAEANKVPQNLLRLFQG